MPNEIIFVAVAGTLCALLLPALLFYRRNERSVENKFPPREGWGMWIVVRLSGFLALMVLLASIFRPSWMTWAQLEIPVWLRYGAGGVGTVTIPLLYWVFHTLGQNLSSDVESWSGQRLLTDGPYRWIRHPVYAVGTLFWIAVSVILANWVILLASLFIFAVIVRRTRIEEEQLAELFGEEYLIYKSLTGRFFPRLNLSGSGWGEIVE